jgi:predicted nucleic-acid-binding Zn-ribbon protein
MDYNMEKDSGFRFGKKPVKCPRCGSERVQFSEEKKKVPAYPSSKVESHLTRIQIWLHVMCLVCGCSEELYTGKDETIPGQLFFH